MINYYINQVYLLANTNLLYFIAIISVSNAFPQDLGVFNIFFYLALLFPQKQRFVWDSAIFVDLKSNNLYSKTLYIGIH